jgi:hypothetical protein
VPPEGPVYLICPRQAWTYLSEYGELEDIGINDQASVRVIFAEEIDHLQDRKSVGEDVIQ